MHRHRRLRGLRHRLRIAFALFGPFGDAPADREIAVHRVVRARLVGEEVGADAARVKLRQDFSGIAEQADRHGLFLRAALFDDRERFVERLRRLVEIAGAQPHFDAARLAFDREARRPRHHRRERLRAAHAAEPGGEQPFARQVAAIMLAPHLDEGLIGALNDALRTDIDPRACGHLAVHCEPALIEFAKMLPVRPVRHEVAVRDEHARRIGMGAEHADRLARLDEQGFVVFEPLQRFDDPVITRPIARRAADAAIDDELVRRLRHIGVEVVHQHPQRRLGEPAFRVEFGAGRCLDGAAVVETRVGRARFVRAGHGHPFAKSRHAASTRRSTGAAAGSASIGAGQFVSSGVAGSVR